MTVANQEKDSNSLLNYTRNLIALRHVTALNNTGEWENMSNLDKPYPWVYQRMAGNERYLVVINPSAKTVSAKINELRGLAVAKVAGVGTVSCKDGVVKASGVSAAVLRIKP